MANKVIPYEDNQYFQQMAELSKYYAELLNLLFNDLDNLTISDNDYHNTVTQWNREYLKKSHDITYAAVQRYFLATRQWRRRE